MAKRNIVKKSTVDQIERLIKEHGVVGMMDTDEYNNMITRNFLNKLEKDNMRTIIAMVNDGKSYDEIRFVVEGGDHSQNNFDSEEDPVAKVHKDFFISGAKVVESTEPVEIIIAGVDDVENKDSEEVERVEAVEAEANDNTVHEEEPTNNVILLKDIINEKKEESIERAENDNSVNDNITDIKTSQCNWTPPKYTKRKKQYPTITLPSMTEYTKELRMYH